MSGKGYTVNTDSLAIRIGELRSLVDSVQKAADTLDLYGAELGPGDLDGAVSDVADHWRDGLGKISDHIGTMADSVKGAVDNYQALEDGGRQRFGDAMETKKQQLLMQAQLQQTPLDQVPQLTKNPPTQLSNKKGG